MAEALAIAVGKGLAIDGAKALAHLIIGRASEEVQLALGYRDQLDKLRRKFEYVEAFLEDLSGSNHQAQKIRLLDTWLKRFQDVAYSTDDLLDEYAYEVIRQKVYFLSRNTNKFRHFFVCTPLFFRFRMSLKIRNILSLFDELDAEAKGIGLNQVEIARDAVRETYNGNVWCGNGRSWNQAREHVSGGFVGRKDDERKLLEMLCDSFNEDSSLPIVSIVGMGGLGKTTLARRVYDHENINTLFGDSKIWICVSENFNIIRLLNEMVEAVTSNKGDLSNKDGIIRKLEEKLKGKRFLLVLDDVWKEDQVLWDSLRESLKRIGGLPGSLILITTRSKKVADAARAVYKHELKELSKDDSWELLKQNVVVDDGSCLEEIGRRIGNKCKGVPLAINVIGCLLMSKENSQHEWEEIETSELWELPQGRNHILPSLLLSFNHLPSPSLKQCFAFCAIFPKGRALEKDLLIAHWSAQGFLHIPSSQTRRLTEEDIGGEFCSILLNNLFLQEDGTGEDGILRYKMHDLVHDLAVYLSKDLLLIREANDQQNVGEYRHLVFTSEQDQMVSEFSEPKSLRKLRTISFEGVHSQNWWFHAQYLRTLILKDINLSELPPAIGLLQHLRFLDLSYNPIRMLPDMICKLYHLQTLRLRKCKRLTNLPSLLNRLVNLRHVFTTTPLYASKGLAELKNLQTLPHLALNSDQQGWTIDELGALSQLRGEICIHGLEHVKNGEEAGKGALNRHSKVMKMTLTWAKHRDETSEGYTDEDVLDGFQPHPAMSSIELKNFYGKAFPSWIMKMAVASQEDITGRLRPLNNLTMLKLLNCSNCQTLPILGHLPSLSTLIMSGLDVEFIGSEFYGNSAGQVFRSLRKLVISGFARLTTWMVPTVEVMVVFPRLEWLQVEDCPVLKAIPALQCESLTYLMLDELSSIESLDIIKACTRLTSLRMGNLPLMTLRDELANCRNLQELIIADFDQLMSLPSLKCMESLQFLGISGLPLISLPDDFFHGLSALDSLFIYGCKNLRGLPSSFTELTSLQKIWIGNSGLEDVLDVLPTNLFVFRKLWYLDIPSYSVVSLRSMLEATEQLPNIKVIGVQGFKDEQQLEEYFSDMTPFLRLQSLNELILVAMVGYPGIRSLPKQLGLLTRITTLSIRRFEHLEEISEWLCNLSSLESLEFRLCRSLKCLPSKEALGRLTQLRSLLITECPLLMKSYVNDKGPEWDKVKHLRYIEVDGKEIF
ncbi:putative disease resistance protein RGA3 [Silene latifolia]|uniref:putative disease resistance protein RGA3 n=1 Tax=Silene latifolia TaxID=37657 RepID=UPI003D77FD03